MNVIYQAMPDHTYLHVAALNGKDVRMVNSDLILKFSGEIKETVIPADRFEFTSITDHAVFHYADVPIKELPVSVLDLIAGE